MLKAIFISIFGLILLLAGMFVLREGLKKYAGSHFQNTIQKLTVTPAKGFFSGVAATIFLQSSTALTVMAVSFVDAGLVPFENTLALILGSNIGSTVTPQLLAFPLAEFSVWLVVAGFAGFIFFKKRLRFLFLSIAGIGTMFFSLSLLEKGMAPITTMPWCQNWLSQLHNNYIYCIMAGTFLSAILHSSSAVTGIAMVLTEKGWLSLPASFAFILGANIGTCFTALIVSVLASRSAQKVAIFHLMANIFGVLVFYPFITTTGGIMELMGDDPARQVANAHTFFNIVSSLMLLPFLPTATRILNKLR
ncbi:MAG: Na/Pi cotransporter family protein [Peptococcaceae bacterium]|jgi:phosphate:Na+ symporter|nr:Na/Pi cotransporter family protein [Peptococcaceae bacterium]